MRISRTQISFLAILAAGATLFVGTLLLPSATTFGSETDVLVEPTTSAQPAPTARPAAPIAPAAQPSASPAPAPPQAPLDDGVGGANIATLPSTGSGGYLSEGQQASVGYLLLALGVTLVGAGSTVWVVSRRSR